MQGILNNHLNQRKANILHAFGVNIVKSNMNDINKANKGGEGSKGGKVVGHTKSGKPVYESGSKVSFKAGNSVVHGTYKGKHEDKPGYHKVEVTHGTGLDTRKKEYEVHDRGFLHNEGQEAEHRKASDERNKKYEQRNAERSIKKAHSGEGSRGGKIIGHTKSGKPIYETANHSGHSDFKQSEHIEAQKLHETLAKKEQDEGKTYSSHAKESDKHGQLANQKQLFENLRQHLKKDEEHFYNVVSKHYQPNDDGESEHAMLENLSKHKDVDKILSKLSKKK